MSSGLNATITRGILPSVDYMKAASLNAGSHVYVFGDKSYDIYDADQGGSILLNNGKYAHPVTQSGGGGVAGVSSVNNRTGAVVLSKSDVSLENVDNTSDTDKPVSIAQQAALNAKQAILVSGSNLKTVNGNSLLGSGNIQITSPVTSVNGKQGTVIVTKEDVSLGSVDNTADIHKPVSAIQQAALDLKVDKVAGKQLSDENYTSGEKSKLANLDDTRYWKGEYNTLLELQTAHPTATAGSYAFVDGGVGTDVQKYIWDTSDTKWVVSGSTTGSETPASIKQKYESNPDTNAYDDNSKAAVDGLSAALGTKVDKVVGKELSSNDYTDDDKALVGTISSKLDTVPVATASTFGGFKYTLTDGGKTLNLFIS